MKPSQNFKSLHTKVKNTFFPKSLSYGSHLALMMSPVSGRMTIGLLLTIFPIIFSRPSMLTVLFPLISNVFYPTFPGKS